MELREFKPLVYPISLLNKDWSTRVCGYSSHVNKDLFLNAVHTFEVYDDDVWLVALPESGTTWMQELLWLVINEFDFEAAKSVDLELRSPFFEIEYEFAEDKRNPFKTLQELKPPRLISTSLPLPLLPPQLWTKKPKTVYVFRNPKDTWVSSYHQHLTWGSDQSQYSLDHHVDRIFETHLPFNSPMEHAAEFFELRNESWIYYTSLECMKTDLRSVIQDVCNHLKKSISDKQMEIMLQHLSWEEMKKNTETNHNVEWKSSVPTPFDLPNYVGDIIVRDYTAISPAVNMKSDKYFKSEAVRLGYTLNELLLLPE